MNLDDGMTANELWTFWHRHQRGAKSRELFPEGGRGTRKAAASLAAYACNKATAMRCREYGDVQAALVYELICDGIYKRLPQWARW